MSIFDKVRSRRDDTSVQHAKEHVKRGEEYQHAGRFPEALREAEEAVRLDPNNADGYYGLGRCNHALARADNERAHGNIYFRAGLDNLDRAIVAYRKVVALQPTAADGFLSQGLACDNACRLEEAEKNYMEAIRLDPVGLDGIDARGNLALLLHMQAIGWAGQKEFPNSLRLSLDDPRLARSFDLAEESIRLAEQRLQRDSGYLSEVIQKHKIVAGLYDRIQRQDRALLHYQAILRLNPGDSKAIERLKGAECERSEDEVYLHPGPLEPARRRLLWMDPNMLGLLAMSNTLTLIQEGNRVIEASFSKEDVEWARKVSEYAVKAEQAGRANRHKEAIEFYKSALKCAPGCDLYLMSIGCCYANMGDLQRGLKYLERAHEISPGEERITQNLSGVRQAAAGRR
jgi:tetratricopeptide (TPR) repeat protein